MHAHMHMHTHTHTRTHLLKKFMQNGTLLLHVLLLLQVLSEVLQGDPGAVGPQMRVKTSNSLGHLHMLVHQIEELFMLWGRRGKFGIGGQSLL